MGDQVYSLDSSSGNRGTMNLPQRKVVSGSGLTLPVEWKASLAALPPEEAKRIESLVALGKTAPLTLDKETGPFFLFVLGDSIEEVAVKSGTPKDVMYLTYLAYNWEGRRTELLRQGSTQMIATLQKQLVNNLLVATTKCVMKQVTDIMSGSGDPEKCPMVPRSLSGLRTLMDMVIMANKLVAPEDAPSKPGTTVINANNVQVNQGVEAEPAKSKTDILKALAGE
jgi:hypothetical protein